MNPTDFIRNELYMKGIPNDLNCVFVSKLDKVLYLK